MKSELATKEQKNGLKAIYNKLWDVLFFLLIFPAIIGSFFLVREVKAFRHKLRQVDTGSHLPDFSDLKLCIPILSVTLILKIICENICVIFTRKIVSTKYPQPTTEEKKIENEKIAKKLAQHIFKGSYYLFISIFAFFVLKDIDYCPVYIGGSGSLKNSYKPGYPESYFFERTKYFNLHYLICLSYSLADIIYLLFIYEKQTDFLNMLLHHICTITLILYSFLTNLSNIGSVVLLIHNITDVVVHITRFGIRAKFPEFFLIITGIILILVFIYLRLFVFAECIYSLAYGFCRWDDGWTTRFLVLFLSCLYLLHVNWTIRLLEKAYQKIRGNKITDTTSFKKSKELKDKKRE